MCAGSIGAQLTSCGRKRDRQLADMASHLRASKWCKNTAITAICFDTIDKRFVDCKRLICRNVYKNYGQLHEESATMCTLREVLAHVFLLRLFGRFLHYTNSIVTHTSFGAKNPHTLAQATAIFLSHNSSFVVSTIRAIITILSASYARSYRLKLKCNTANGTTTARFML